MPGQIARGGIGSKVVIHLFEFATAIAWFLIGVNYLTNHHSGARSAIGQVIHPFDFVWCSMYVAGAPLIVYGLLREEQRFRVSGLTLMGTGLFMNFIAALSIKPLEARDFTYLIFSAACFIRCWLAAETVRSIRPGRGSRPPS